MIEPPIVKTAATQAGNQAPGAANPRMTLSADSAAKEITPFHHPGLEGQLMCSSLVRDTQVTAGKPPLGTMRRKAPAAMTMLRQQMCRLMQKCPFDFLVGDLL
jgi:hypothetical protein